MEEAEHLLTPPDEFPFPFQPYPIQKDFMRNLYSVLENGKLGIFESPTGTGKSQSLICGSLRWLQDHEAREKRLLSERIASMTIKDNRDEDSSAGDWISAQASRLEKEHSKRQLQAQLELIQRKEERLRLLKKRVNERKIAEQKKASFKKQLPTKLRKEASYGGDSSVTNKLEEDNKDDYMLVQNDGEGLMENREEDVNSAEEEEGQGEKNEEEKPKDVKIIICSRTHSQLSQLVGEIKKSPYSDSVRLVALASRSNYCVNPSVRKLGSLTLINERCRDLQQKNKKKNDEKVTAIDEEGVKIKRSRCEDRTGNGSCSYRPSAGQLSEEALASVMDMEDIVARGRSLAACPYYATRSAVNDAQVLILPYNILLHKGTREACGLDLRGSVVIIDEAHNLLDTIQHIHSAEVSHSVLKRARSQLDSYQARYKSRFTPHTVLNLNQIIFIVNKLIQMSSTKDCRGQQEKGGGEAVKVMTMQDFLSSASIDNLNMNLVLDFCRKAKLAQKLQGFVQNRNLTEEVKAVPSLERGSGVQAFLKQIQIPKNQKITEEKKPVAHDTNKSPDAARCDSDGADANAIPALVSFLECLTNRNEDGRVICTRGAASQQGSVKFLLLNPASHFTEIVRDARSIVVAGGTMKPITEFRDQLFLSGGVANADRVVHFACGHIVSADRILPIVMPAGPTGQVLDFSYTSRENIAVLDEVGRLLVNATNVIPAGIVCFLTSYSYEKIVYEHLQRTGILEKISAKKRIFREPKESNQVDKVLQDYAKTIKTANMNRPDSKLTGALLFSVVGGKLSEGLNFSDDLGRAVLLVGLPFPNIKSAELQEKMSYLTTVHGRRAGEEHYKNLCMKAVNQTIGRAIRHKDDYAVIWLLDNRFARSEMQADLPDWIRSSLVTADRFGAAMRDTARFFAMRKKVKNV